MKLTQENKYTYRVVLNDAEFSDLKAEASHSDISLLDVMKAIFLMTFVQFLSCRYFRRTLGTFRSENPKDDIKPHDKEWQDGG